VSCLRHIQAGAAAIESDLVALQQELEALLSVNESIRDIFTAELHENRAVLAVDSGGFGITPVDYYKIVGQLSMA